MRRLLASAPASAGSASVAAVLIACATAAPAGAGVVSVVGTQATAQLSGSGGLVAQDTFLISSLLTEFYYSQGGSGNSYAAFAMDVKASSIKFTFDFEGYASMMFSPGASMQVAFSPSISIDSFTVGAVDAGVFGVDTADLSHLGNVVVIDLSGIGTANAGDSFTLNFSASAVPGPAGLAGLAMLAAGRRRRR